jgi:hypothetical protein
MDAAVDCPSYACACAVTFAWALKFSRGNPCFVPNQQESVSMAYALQNIQNAGLRVTPTVGLSGSRNICLAVRPEALLPRFMQEGCTVFQNTLKSCVSTPWNSLWITFLKRGCTHVISLCLGTVFCG